MEEKLIEKFFKEFKTITKKNLTRKERSYYCASLEAILQHIKGDARYDLLLKEILSVPITDWYDFFHKINILDRNYRRKFEEVYGCYQFFKSGEKITEKQKTELDKPISSKKFIKSLIKLINSGRDDILVDKIIGTDFSIKQLFKLYHILNIYLDDNDYRKDILLNTTYNKLTSLINKYAKKSEIKKHGYISGRYPIDKYKDRINYLYLRYEDQPNNKSNYKEKDIIFDVKDGEILNNKFHLLGQKQPEICTLFNCNIPIFSATNYIKLSIKDIATTFSFGKFLISFIEVKPNSSNCRVSLNIKDKNILNISHNICKILSKPIRSDKSSIWVFIYNPISEILLFGENIPIQIINKLNIKKCDRLIKKLKESNLSIEEIFSSNELSGDLGEENLCDIMNKNS